MDAATLERLFRRAFKTSKFFPKVAEILEPIQKAEASATPEAAEMEWEHVLELRRLYWNPDMSGGFSRGMPKLSERVAQACRAADVWRDFDSVDDLHTWAKKRFVGSYIVFGDLERDGFLLPEGEIKRLLTDAAKPKALPAPSVDFHTLHKRGLEYAAKTNLLSAWGDAAAELPKFDPEAQKEIETELEGYRERFSAALVKRQANP
jgi:hypothetical protein